MKNIAFLVLIFNLNKQQKFFAIIIPNVFIYKKKKQPTILNVILKSSRNSRLTIKRLLKWCNRPIIKIVCLLS